jgi:hypothetical protein
MGACNINFTQEACANPIFGKYHQQEAGLNNAAFKAESVTQYLD